jgi:hypothetical protein
MLQTWSIAEMEGASSSSAALSAHVLPNGFEPPCPYGEAKPKTTHTQQHDAYALVEESVRDCQSEAWDAKTQDNVLCWWTSHCSVGAVLWSAALHGLPFEKTSKADTVKMLMRVQAPIISFRQMDVMQAVWEGMSGDDQFTLSSKTPPPRPKQFEFPAPGGNSDSMLADQGSCSPPSIRPHHVPLTSSSAGDGESKQSRPSPHVNSSDDTSTEFLGMMRRIVASMSDHGPTPAVVPDGLKCPVDKLLADALAAIESGSFFEIASISSENIRKLQFRAVAGKKQSVRFGDFQLVGGRFEEVDWSSRFVWDEFASGWLRWISLMAGSSKVQLIPDRCQWYEKLLSFKHGTAYAKAKFAKFFMLKYAKSACWSGAFDSDSAILIDMLFQTAADRGYNGGTPRQGGGGGAGGDPNNRSLMSNKRHRPNESPRPRNSLRPNGGPKRMKKLCFTRVDKARGECVYPNCKFSHACVCCSGDHSAAMCTSWSQAKADVYTSQ